MRTPVLIVVAGIAAFALAWALLQQVPRHARAPKSAVTATQTAAPPAHRDAGASALLAQPAEAPRETAAVAPAPAPPAPEPPRHGPPATAPIAPQPAPRVDAPEADEPTDTLDDEPPAEPGDGTDDADARPAPIDADHAADLMADWLAKEEVEAETKGSTDQPENPALRDWTAFSGEETDSKWSEPSELQIEAALERWIAALPDPVRQHVAIVHIECRLSLCQILAADNDVATENDRAGAGQEWQQALATLPEEAWWSELGFVGMETTVSMSDDGSHTLYQTYLRRQAPTPPA